MQFPGYGVQDTGQAVLGNATAKERVRCKSAERVIAYFGVGGGGTLAHEVKIDVGANWSSVQEGQPDVDSQLGLLIELVRECQQRAIAQYHAIAVGRNASHENVVAQIIQARGEISSRRALEEEQVEVGHGRRMGRWRGGSGMHCGGGAKQHRGRMRVERTSSSAVASSSLCCCKLRWLALLSERRAAGAGLAAVCFSERARDARAAIVLKAISLLSRP